MVEYALHDTHKPIGVATSEITKTLPKALKGQLPTPEELQKQRLGSRVRGLIEYLDWSELLTRLSKLRFKKLCLA